MAYTPLSAVSAGQLITAAFLNAYLRDNLNAINTGGGKVPPLAIAWWGALATIPSNWFACDGTLGIRDLRDRMVVGAGSTYAVGDTGGALTAPLSAHTTHSLATPAHTDHAITAAGTHGSDVLGISDSGSIDHIFGTSVTHSNGASTGAHTHSGTALTDTHAHSGSPYAVVPPYWGRTPVIKGLATLSFTTPRTWTDGDVPTAAMFNADLRDNINYLRQQTLQLSIILLWSGSLASLPSGYQLCDGTNLTPDLRDRFVISAGLSYAVDASGGAALLSIAAHGDHGVTQAGAHGTHGLSLGSHSAVNGHGISGANAIHEPVDHSETTISANHSAHSGFAVDAHAAHANVTTLPPYIALGYIMLTSAGIYTTPRTWTDGELVDAGRINTYLRDNEASIYSCQAPIGVIFAWHDTIAAIPSGYALANGSGGTVDTRDRFVQGAGLGYAVGATGGATSATPAVHGAHAITQPSTHTVHTLNNGSHVAVGRGFAPGGGPMLTYLSFTHDFALQADAYHAHAFAVDAGAAHSAHDTLSLLPPYTALAFIQRTS